MNKYELSEAYIGGPTGRIEGKRRIYGGGGGDSGSSTTTPTIPTELKPLANLYTKQATNIANTPFQYYDGQRYAGLNDTQNQGISMVQDRALNGSQTMNNAEQNLNQMMNGQSNPYLDAMVQKAQGSVMSNAATAANRSGSFGNTGIQEQALNSMGSLANDMYGQQYQFDQGQRMNAIGMAPTFGNQAYQDAGQLLNAGGLQQQTAQNNLDFNYQQFQDAQNNPYKQLSATGGVVGQGMGSSTTSSGGGK